VLGLERIVEKAYVLAARASGGTRGTAEDSGAGDGEDERAVQRAFAIDYGLPTAVLDRLQGAFVDLLRGWLLQGWL